MWNLKVYNVAIALPILDDIAVNSTILKFLNTNYLFIYLLPRPAARVPVTSSRR